MGIDFKLKWYGKDVQDDVKAAGTDGLKDASQMLLDESNKIAPIEEGALIGSGETDVDSNKLEASVFYDTPYAVRQHEDMSLSHKNGRQSKFLESAYKQNIQHIRDYLAKAMKEKL